MSMTKIKKMSKEELNNTVPFIWKVFYEYEAENYPEAEEKAFWDVINDKSFLNELVAYGAYIEDRLVGVIATRNRGAHIALFFVDGEYQRRGIGRALFNTILKENNASIVTVNSSIFALPIYKKLGFIQSDEMHMKDGIKYIPMEYHTRFIKMN